MYFYKRAHPLGKNTEKCTLFQLPASKEHQATEVFCDVAFIDGIKIAVGAAEALRDHAQNAVTLHLTSGRSKRNRRSENRSNTPSASYLVVDDDSDSGGEESDTTGMDVDEVPQGSSDVSADMSSEGDELLLIDLYETRRLPLTTEESSSVDLILQWTTSLNDEVVRDMFNVKIMNSHLIRLKADKGKNNPWLNDEVSYSIYIAKY